MRCERIKEWMGDHLDGCLNADRTRAMNAHLAGCDACRRELDELRQTVALLRGMPSVLPPSDLLSSVHRRLAPQQESPVMVFWRVLSLPQTRRVAAAALIVVVGAYGWRTLTAGHGGEEQERSGQSPTLQKTEKGRDDLRVVRIPAGAPAAAGTVRSPEGEAKGQIWGGVAAGGGRKSKAQVVGGLSVGDESEVADVRGNRGSAPLATGASAPATIPAGPALARRALSVRPAAKSADASVDRLATAKADTYAAAAPTPEATPVRRSDREIVLAASDAAAVRRILAQYVVRGEDKQEEAASARVTDSENRGDRSAESGTPITGWVPEARYAQLLASLQSVGTVKSLPEKRSRVDSDATDLLFVKIRLVAPVK